ncbi:serine/threonine-protein kinase [Paraliomyxa miuraensis]|uniref:serine/threonine-protein kinase n=1 Tax=Paraliomyxa miuraensis TaxID=376150 RepID=UPI00224CD72C|nr:serine/threonine-protein kinase [Paraliomyxa miuraensis]MCX4243232.1 protein kinase [Paraliomyxa miuraensis]
MSISNEIGQLLRDRYKITDIIGEGGMGVVYEAWDTQVERKVAIKLVRSDTTADRKFITRFRRELEITSQLRHPSTIRVFEHGELEDGRPYMVMELLTGESLADRLERGHVPEMEALQIARQVAESLSEAHEHGVFHRDLKPDNIFIETVGVSKVVKVLDFGIAGGVDATRLTQAGEVFGTPQYMSPEQCNGLPLDHRTDIYSLAIILFEMIEGRPPFAAETPMATMLKHVRAKVPAMRHAGKETSRVVSMGLRKDRGKRIQTAGRFAELIGECIGHLRAAREGREGSGSVPNLTGTGAVRTAALTTSSMASTGLPVSVPPAMGPGPGEQTGKIVAVVLGVAALVLVGVMVFGGLGSSSTETGDGTDPSSNEASASGASDGEAGNSSAPTYDSFPFNRALVSTNVTGAKVFVDGEEQGETPCEIKVPVDGKTHEIRLEKDGHTSVTHNWRPKSVGEPLPPLPDMKAL